MSRDVFDLLGIQDLRGAKSPRSVQREDIDRHSGMRLSIRYAVRLVVRRYGESASVDELEDATKESVVLEYANCHGFVVRPGRR